MAMLLEQIGCFASTLQGTEFGDHRIHLLCSSVTALLGMDRLEHLCDVANLARGHHAEDVAVE